MQNLDLNLILMLVMLASCVISISALLYKINQLARSEETVKSLKKSLDELDEQAKLIIRTDMELNKTQEELDKKINGLYALQRLSRLISTTLEEKQVFQKINPELIEELGFEKASAWLWVPQEKKFTPYLNIGFDEEGPAIEKTVTENPNLFLQFIEGAKTISSISGDYKIRQLIRDSFRSSSFVVSPILAKEGNNGFLFVGTNKAEAVINEGDEELVTVLTNQLGQAIDNARFFENTWKAQQELEHKVEERTRALKDALEEVKKISKRKTDFVSSVSHELRTPLTSIKGYAAILLAGKLGSIPQQVGERLEKINRHSDELVHMVNDLLDISRIESGKTIMKPVACCLRDTVTKVQDLLSVQTKEKQICVSVNIPEDANMVLADISHLERVFINLLWNAIKFTPAKGKITISSHTENTMVEVDITDTGCGIPESSLESIFDEFYRVENEINEQTKGTGLGLSLVRHIIQAHKGKIWANSKLAQGSTFSFTLPQAG